MRSDERKQLPKICWGGRVKHQFKGLLFILISVFVAAGCSTGGNVRYAVVKGQAGDLETYQLVDAEADIKVSIAPGMGNTAYEFLVGGEDIFHLQVPLGELREKKVLGGNPLLSPWVSRLDGAEYYFEGKKYVLDESLGNLHHDKVGKILHGLVIWSPHWKVAKSGASAEEGAYLVSTLDFKSFPDLMAQFPFAPYLGDHLSFDRRRTRSRAEDSERGRDRDAHRRRVPSLLPYSGSPARQLDPSVCRRRIITTLTVTLPLNGGGSRKYFPTRKPPNSARSN